MVIPRVASGIHRGGKISHVLVVEDDALLLRSVARMLGSGGHVVLEATDVDTALGIARQEDLDVALVDYQLRRESGMEVLGALRHLAPGCTRILMTGLTDGAVFVDAINGGVHGVLRKPFSREQLFDALLRSHSEVDSPSDHEERRGLDDAIDPARMGMALQPIVRAVGGGDPERIVAYEALLRPRHPEFGSPLRLLDAAERHGRVHDVGGIVMRLATERLRRIPGDAQLFVNVHPAQLGRPRVLLADLEGLSHAADRVVLEITERRPIDEIEDLAGTVAQIRERGFSFAVDDLGVGYSSLAIVADLGPEYVKLDMSLIRNIHRSSRRTRLVQSLQRFGDQTDIKVVAEGVETPEEREALLECGIRFMQGYFWARPSETTP
ncbi:MAG: EAL domain-containing protein [Myxococcales bacterium]|nr:EAL domain-containing protein [Myxococcales bacterium]